MFEHLDLQCFFGSEMGEEPALGELELLGESTNRQPTKARLAGQARGALKDGMPG
jgi:hypothetical protein